MTIPLMTVNLSLDISKTKAMVYSNLKIQNTSHFTYRNPDTEVCLELFLYNGRFKEHVLYASKKAAKHFLDSGL